ncbi:hypothetical protein BVH03_24820, partial [Pseudomonas sp. PA15(2017)]|uniref:retention module-containing protein n=1 Tax=Pseudomonas sp. PA15(2017) TaxID=1932111 RepID=UPI000960BB71
MSNFAAVIKSLIGQVFVTSVDGVRRQVFEGDRIFAGEQVTTADGGSVTLEMANGETVKLGANSSWQAGNPDTRDAAEAAQAPSSEFEQALAAGMDPTVDLEPTAAGPGAGGGGGSAGGGHSAVMLSETAQRVDPTIGFQTTGLGTPGFNLIEDNDPAIFTAAAATPTTSPDTTAPVVTISIDPITGDDVLNSSELSAATVNITGTVGGEARVGDAITLNLGGNVYSGTVVALGNGALGFSIPVSSADLGTFSSISATVSSADAAGNVGTATANRPYTIDTIAPVITVNAPAVTNDTTPTITGTTDAPVGSTVTLTITQGSTVITVTTPVLAGGTFTVDVPQALVEGPYTVGAQVNDPAGNTGSATNSGAIDTTAPAITVDTPAITNDTTPTITGTTDAPVGSTVALTITQGTTTYTVNTPVLAGGTYSVELTQPLVEGPYTVEAQVTDQAGNTGSANDSGAIDTTAPLITVDAPAITNDTTPTITGTTDAPVGSTVTLTVTQNGSSFTVTTPVLAGGTYSVELTQPLVEGPYTVEAQVTDQAGNTGSANDSGAIDTTAPLITVDAPAITNDTTPTITGTTDAPVGSVVTLTITQGTTVLTTTATVVAGGTYSADVPAGLVEGSYSVDAKVTDAAGNTGSATDSGAIDTTAPVPTITLDANITADDVINIAESGQQIPVTGNVGGDAKVGDTVTLTVNGKTFTGQVQANNTFSINVPGADLVADAGKTVTASISTTDAAGNVGTATATEGYSVDITAPLITVDAPAITNDTTPTITGTTDAPVGSIVTLTITQGTNTFTVNTPVLAGGTYSIELTQPLVDGPYSVDARVTDAAGNPGSANDNGTINTTAPLITVDAPVITNNTTPTIIGTSDAPVGSTVTLTIVQGTNTFTVDTPVLADGTYSVELPQPLAEGPYSVNAEVTDAAGNTGSATDSGAIDTTAPLITVDAPAITNDTTPTITGTTDAPVGSVVTLTITQGTNTYTVNTPVLADGTYNIELPQPLAEGSYSVDAKVTDAAGNTGSATDSGAIDTTPPAPTITLDANITADNVINIAESSQQIPVTGTVGGDAKIGDTVTLTVNGKEFTGSVVANAYGTLGFSINVPGADLVADAGKTVTASISTTDAAGNIGTATDTEGYSVDVTAPVPTITLDANITADDVINIAESSQQIPVTGTVGGDAKVGDTVTLTVNGKEFTGSVVANANGTLGFSINVPGADLVADAGKTISASISTTDAAGNIGTATDTEGYSVDVTAPVPTITLDANITADDVINIAESSQQIPVTGTVGGDAKIGDTVTLTVNGKEFTGSVVANANGTLGFSINVPGADLVADAGKTISASISTTDAAGNIGTATDTEGYSVDVTAPVPTITLDANITADDVINIA